MELAELVRGGFLYTRTLAEPTIDHNGIPERWVLTLCECEATLRRGGVVFSHGFLELKTY